MKQTMNFHNFVDGFRACGREEQFSYAALRVLWDYLERFEEDSGTELEFDPIALCCDYAEESVESVCENYSLEADDAEALIEKLSRDTWAAVVDEQTVIYCQY
jgi:hypothetical protein